MGRFWFVAARRERWLWLSALVLESCAWWFAARGQRQARMCSPEAQGLRFVFAADDSLVSRCPGKMQERRPFGPVRRCKPTSRRRGRSWMDSQMNDFGVEDKCKLHFYSRADGEKDLLLRARAMRWKCK